MNQEITFWGLAVPTAVASIIGSLVMWLLNHRSTKEVRALESRLHREEETYRLAQSPRVAAAIKLWAAFCQFEMRVNCAVYLAKDRITSPGDDQELEHADEVASEAWVVLTAAKNEAECLLDEATLDAFVDLLDRCDAAQYEIWSARQKKESHALAEAYQRASATMKEVKERRPAVVKAIRKLISSE